MFPTPVFNRGVAYYKNGQVEDLSFDINHHVYTARVHGTEAYFVEVNLTNFENGSIRAYCDCPAFDTYDSCKHIVAVLLDVAEQTADQTQEVNYETTDRFITAITSTQRSEPEFLPTRDRKSTRLNSSHVAISYAVFCLKKKKKQEYLFVV